MIALTFKIHLQEPLLATELQGDPNSAVTTPFIPGSALRGAIIGRYLDQHHAIDDFAKNQLTRQLFLNGQTCYLNAHPLNHNHRTLPTPISWNKEKYNESKIYDLSVEPDIDDSLKAKLKPIGKPFCYLNENYVIFESPSKIVNIHTQRDRKAGRSQKGQGTVFRYEAIAPGQTFAGVVLCPTQEIASTLEELLKNEPSLFIGGSQNAGYGLVKIEDVKTDTNWSEVPLLTTPIKAGEQFTLTLLSDAIIRDKNGQYLTTLTEKWFANYLGTKITLVKDSTYVKSTVVSGFNKKWGLPLPQTPAISAGSVYTVQAEEDIPMDKLETLQMQGIGERKSEGFGRIGINWHNQYEEINVDESIDPISKQSQGLTDESQELAQQMVDRMFRQTLDAQLREKVLNLGTVNGEINNTQVSHIRALVRSSLITRDKSIIISHTENMKKAAREQFDKAQMDRQKLSDWLIALLTISSDEVWLKLFNTDDKISILPTLGNIQAKWDSALADEYALRLIDGVLNHTLANRRKE